MAEKTDSGEASTVTNKKMEIRCPRLGGPVPLAYCEQTGENGLPCFKIADCWWQYFDVVGYLKKRLTAEQLHAVLDRRPPPKVTGILDIIEQARRNSGVDNRDP
jgi:hypothetical protein